MLTNTDLTIYNRVRNTETYYRTYIAYAHWQNRKAANVLSSGGRQDANQAEIYIPFLPGYEKPKAWQTLTNKAAAWTLQVGDVVVKGFAPESINSNFTITALKAKYDDALTITSVDTMDYGGPNMMHHKIGAA